MDATIALLRDLEPLARGYGWPVVCLVVFLWKMLPHLAAIAQAHVRLIDTLRETLPRSVRNQSRQTKALSALTSALKSLHHPAVARSERHDRPSSPLASLIP